MAKKPTNKFDPEKYGLNPATADPAKVTKVRRRVAKLITAIDGSLCAALDLADEFLGDGVGELDADGREDLPPTMPDDLKDLCVTRQTLSDMYDRLTND